MNKIFTLSASLFFLISCGGSKSDRNMELSEQYTVSSGDKVMRDGENTLLKITHVSGEKKSTIELLEGNATIIYKQ